MGKDLEKLNSIPKGTTDYYGREAKLRDYVLGKIQKNYKKYGFESLYTPIIENAEVFHGFHGEGEKLLFNLKDRDNENYVLKYDSTVPLARVVSMHDDISLPYKRYQLQQSYRDDEIDKGHFREFIQCDGDVVGCNSLATDAEFVMLSYDGLKELGFENFTIRLNHRAIIKAIAEKSGLMNKEDTLEIQRAIDYADKVIKNGTEGIRSDLEKRNINGKVINIIIDLVDISNNSKDINDNLDKIDNYFQGNENAKKGVDELREITSLIPDSVLDKTKIDFTLARGADYYTGFIIEAVINDLKLGAVLGGGRYDNLVEAFNNKKIPAVGMAFGMERIIVAMKELGLDKAIDIENPKFMLYANDKIDKTLMDLTKKLREKYDVSLITSEDLSLEEAKEYCKNTGVDLFARYDKENGISVEKIKNNDDYYHNVKKYVKELTL